MTKKESMLSILQTVNISSKLYKEYLITRVGQVWMLIIFLQTSSKDYLKYLKSLWV